VFPFPFGFTLLPSQLFRPLPPKFYLFLLGHASDFFSNFFRSSVRHLNAIEFFGLDAG
jgi:hypothetical protein